MFCIVLSNLTALNCPADISQMLCTIFRTRKTWYWFVVCRIISLGVWQLLRDYFMVIGSQNRQKHFTKLPLHFLPPLSYPTFLFTHSGTFRTTSSKGAMPSHRSWRGRRRLCRSRPRRRERPWTGPSTLPLPSIACGCACTPSWASCV